MKLYYASIDPTSKDMENALCTETKLIILIN